MVIYNWWCPLMSQIQLVKHRLIKFVFHKERIFYIFNWNMQNLIAEFFVEEYSNLGPFHKKKTWESCYYLNGNFKQWILHRKLTIQKISQKLAFVSTFGAHISCFIHLQDFRKQSFIWPYECPAIWFGLRHNKLLFLQMVNSDILTYPLELQIRVLNAQCFLFNYLKIYL